MGNSIHRTLQRALASMALALLLGFAPASAQQAGETPPEVQRAVRELSRAAFKDIPLIKEAINRGAYADAERMAREGLAIMPKTGRLLGLQAEALLRAGRNAEALAALNDYREPSRNDAWRARVALLKFRLGHKQESLQLANQGMVKDLLPTHLKDHYPSPKTIIEVEAYWLFAIGLQENETANNEYYFLASHRLRPQPVALNALLGNVLSERKKFEQAIACFDVVIASHPDPKYVRSKKFDRAYAEGQLRRDQSKARSGIGG